MTGRLDFGFTFGSPGAGAKALARRGEALRILVLADFSGHGLRGLVNPKPLGQRMPQQVDIDNVDAVLKRMGPAVSLALPEPVSARLDLSFATVEDFHPDQLLGKLPTVAAASSVTAAPPAASAAAQVPENDAATLERLLGRKPAASPTDGLDAMIKSIVAPSLVPDSPPGLARSQAAAQASKGEVLRAVLHHADFQALEATWRGVQGLVRSLDLNEDLQVHLLDVTQAELVADVEAAQGDLAATQLMRGLSRQRDADERAPSWPLVVGLYAFGPSAQDIGLLSSLGTLAQQVGGAFMASAQPSVLGLDSFAACADPSDWPGMSSEDLARWEAFQSRPEAISVHLTAPRILLRLPYGKATDPIESLASFDEMPAVFKHEACLWGHGALACAQLMGLAFTAHGWDLRLGEHLDVEDLPSYVVVRDGEKRLLACAEANLSEGAGERLLGLGLMPLLSYKHRNAVRVMSFRAMARQSD
jgi:type VI secretion system protein ImpC